MDSTPPIPGHVYDGNITQTDQDFQVDTGVLYSSWEGFHDPHTGIVGYSWRVGSCPGCDDVLPDRDVGLVNGESFEVSIFLLLCTPTKGNTFLSANRCINGSTTKQVVSKIHFLTTTRAIIANYSYKILFSFFTHMFELFFSNIFFLFAVYSDFRK